MELITLHRKFCNMFISTTFMYKCLMYVTHASCIQGTPDNSHLQGTKGNLFQLSGVRIIKDSSYRDFTVKRY